MITGFVNAVPMSDEGIVDLYRVTLNGTKPTVGIRNLLIALSKANRRDQKGAYQLFEDTGVTFTAEMMQKAILFVTFEGVEAASEFATTLYSYLQDGGIFIAVAM